ncbi:MAG: tripartite tricarboxylate transporter TctB family protein [Marivita sp.]|uniref:tripartite tricarboxylate transporter TctB family protein n=1 Tax=Marivita sp. TaxID=2003365 RepID=UPI0025BC453F|nr:tripartite tricarboxylate transporter TctB family protein [Marivita sp.]MCI5111235.1 tripartite tricarboxylate transporter TctB family protein [Marivita sp.]
MHRDRLISQIGPALMLLVGLGFVFGSVTTLELGSARRMGPGAFPAIVGALLSVLALITLVRNLRYPMGWDRPDPISVFAVAGGVAAFAFLTPLLGVLPAVIVSVLTTASAVPQFRWPGRVVLAFCVAGAVWLVFVKGLGIPLPTIRGL